MSPLFLSWIVLILTAFTVATLIGIFHPCVPGITKERLKYLEVEKGYKGEIVYRGQPIVEIVERYNLKNSYLLIGLVLFLASLVPTYSQFLTDSVTFFLGNNLVLCRFLIFVISLALHMVFCMILSFYAFSVSEMRFSDLEKYYKNRQAVVKIKKFL